MIDEYYCAIYHKDKIVSSNIKLYKSKNSTIPLIPLTNGEQLEISYNLEVDKYTVSLKTADGKEDETTIIQNIPKEIVFSQQKIKLFLYVKDNEFKDQSSSYNFFLFFQQRFENYLDILKKIWNSYYKNFLFPLIILLISYAIVSIYYSKYTVSSFSYITQKEDKKNEEINYDKRLLNETKKNLSSLDDKEDKCDEIILDIAKQYTEELKDSTIDKETTSLENKIKVMLKNCERK